MPSPPPVPDLDPFLARAALPPGWCVLYEPIVGSTMDLARAAARRAWPDRSVFVCDEQTAGRGRHGRRWEAAPGRGLLFTVLLRGLGPPIQATLLASVALAEAVERLLGLEVAIKWPNDLLLGDRKLAGVLTEAYAGPSGAYALVGCGLNANQTPVELAPLGRAATSLRIEAGRPVHRGALLVLGLERLDAWLALAPPARALALRRSWEDRLWGRGLRLRLRDAGQEFEATIAGLEADGTLVLRDQAGQLRRTTTAEIVL